MNSNDDIKKKTAAGTVSLQEHLEMLDLGAAESVLGMRLLEQLIAAKNREATLVESVRVLTVERDRLRARVAVLEKCQPTT